MHIEELIEQRDSLLKEVNAIVEPFHIGNDYYDEIDESSEDSIYEQIYVLKGIVEAQKAVITLAEINNRTQKGVAQGDRKEGFVRY